MIGGSVRETEPPRCDGSPDITRGTARTASLVVKEGKLVHMRDSFPIKETSRRCS
jgi:hypothetical protein